VIGLHGPGLFSGAYKAPQELNWVVGVVLLLLVVVIAFTGYALRWDQDGSGPAVVGMKIGSYSRMATIQFLMAAMGRNTPASSPYTCGSCRGAGTALSVFTCTSSGAGVLRRTRWVQGRLAKLKERQRLEEFGSTRMTASLRGAVTDHADRD